MFKGNSVELMGKETKLLFLLYKFANTTLECEHILNTVWGMKEVTLEALWMCSLPHCVRGWRQTLI